jgi:hypothetical protein
MRQAYPVGTVIVQMFSSALNLMFQLIISQPFNSQMTQMTERTLVLLSSYLNRVEASGSFLLKREIDKRVYFRHSALFSHAL